MDPDRDLTVIVPSMSTKGFFHIVNPVTCAQSCKFDSWALIIQHRNNYQGILT
jgi:hypothetical protein